MKKKSSAEVVRTQLEDDKKFVMKKYVSLKEGVVLYSIGLTKLRIIAEEAGAIRKIGGIVLINTEAFERYLEAFKVVGD